MFTVNIIFKGRVQGVGFRNYAKECADSLKISGSAWNNYDGTFEMIAYCNTRLDIDVLLSQIKVGTDMSSVSHSSVHVIASDPPKDYGFEIID